MGKKVPRDRSRDLVANKRMRVFESLEPRHLMNADWRNPARPLDVNNDGLIAPLDALIILNRLRADDSIVLPTRANRLAHYYDVNGDSLATPLDALLVLNAVGKAGSGYVNDFARTAAGESELAPAGFISSPFAVLPGTSDQQVVISASLNIHEKEFNELGLFVVDDASGDVNGVSPSSPDYPEAVFRFARRSVLYSKQAPFRTQVEATFPGGSIVHIYVLQGTTSDGDPSSHLRTRDMGGSKLLFGWEEHASRFGHWPPAAKRPRARPLSLATFDAASRRPGSPPRRSLRGPALSGRCCWCRSESRRPSDGWDPFDWLLVSTTDVRCDHHRTRD